MAEKFETVDEYIASFGPEVQEMLQGVRRSIRSVIPDAVEGMAYGIVSERPPGRHALYFGGWKKHIGLYPVPRLGRALEVEIVPYRASKDSLNFAYSKPIPYDLIARVTAELFTEAP